MTFLVRMPPISSRQMSLRVWCLVKPHLGETRIQSPTASSMSSCRSWPSRRSRARHRSPCYPCAMLTDSLRQMEDDGLVFRHDYGENPPRVEYGLTELGRQMMSAMGDAWRRAGGEAHAYEGPTKAREASLSSVRKCRPRCIFRRNRTRTSGRISRLRSRRPQPALHPLWACPEQAT